MELALGLMRGCWAEERDVDDEATRAAIVESQGLDPSALSAGSIADDVDKIYQANTDEAIEQGMFGAPWYVISGLGYWGQDRLDFVDRALAKV